MKKNKCDKCKFDGHCAFQDQVPKDLVIKDCEWFRLKETK